MRSKRLPRIDKATERGRAQVTRRRYQEDNPPRPKRTMFWRCGKSWDEEDTQMEERRNGDMPESECQWQDGTMVGHCGEIRFEANQVKKQVNAVQKEITAKRKAKEPFDEFLEQKNKLEAQVAEMEKAVDEEERVMRAKAATIGNLVNKGVPISQTEDDNKVLKTWHPDGPNAQVEKKSDILAHHEVMIRIGAFDTERGSKVAGHRGFFLTEDGRGYKKIQPPFFMRKDAMAKTAQLDQFDEELYKVSGDGEDKYLIATSEQPISAFHSDELFDQPEKQLPIKLSFCFGYAGYSTCFRKEAGAAGRDTWGIFRVHQFEKVEQFCITQPEHSWEMFEHMVENAEAFYQSLKILRFGSLVPVPGAYKELVSCSNCTDYQSRRLRIQCGQKQKGDTRTNWVHMLNGTLCATERALCCIVENYQSPEGLVIPEVLRPYMQGRELLPYAPVVVVAVVCVMLVAFGWWKRRKRTREFIQQLQTTAATTNNNSTSATNNISNSNTTTTNAAPTTGADAPARPPRRRRRRRPSQISTKSLPAYNEQAGDEEIVLVRRAENQNDSDDDDSNEQDDEPPNTTRQPSSSSRAPDSRPLLDDDSSPDMPRVSLASIPRTESAGPRVTGQYHLCFLSRKPSLSLNRSRSSQSQTIRSEDNRQHATTLHPYGDTPTYDEAMSTSHVHLPSTDTAHTTEPSTSTNTDLGQPRPTQTQQPSGSSAGHGSAPSESVEMTDTSPRPSTSTHRPSGSTSAFTHRPSTSLSVNAHKPSPSLSSLSLILTRSQSPTMSRTSLNISSPSPPPSSRESLGRFGMPYGEEAIAAARSREYLPPIYQPRVGEAGATTGADESGAISGTGGTGGIAGTNEITRTGSGSAGAAPGSDDDPTVTIRRGPMILTPGELATRQHRSGLAVSAPADPDPTVTITVTASADDTKEADEDYHEPGPGTTGVGTGTGLELEGFEKLEDTMVIQEEPMGIYEEAMTVQPKPRATRDYPTTEHHQHDLANQDSRRESVYTTHSFVTATEGERDSSPPTPTPTPGPGSRANSGSDSVSGLGSGSGTLVRRPIQIEVSTPSETQTRLSTETQTRSSTETQTQSQSQSRTTPAARKRCSFQNPARPCIQS
ncbi:threonyl-tRNA synthetase [Rhizoctonia solani]|uniref:serine--tRNA ligase n=1 Tax=Rhizoctonia solani TaxID=456999 RepID=A0A8H8P548_9AGAM|nr:threonyl-tRNA synthetase [Rhizoctonia solani]QRW25816.1 threonyl-tRNA synthetase [Rhizoctonia solani]